MFTSGGGYGLWANADWTSFAAKWQQRSGNGLRLVDFDVALTGVESLADAAGAAVRSDADVQVVDLIPEDVGFSSLAPEIAVAGELLHNGVETGEDGGEPEPGSGFLSSGIATGTGERSDNGVVAEVSGVGDRSAG